MTTEEKCFLVTAAMEGSAGYASLSGSFDSAGISFGVIQFNLLSGTLQPLLLDMHRNGPATFARCFTQYVAQMNRVVNLAPDILAVCNLPAAVRNGCRGYWDAVDWAEDRQDAGHRLHPHWTRAFKALAEEPGFNAIQRGHARPYMDRAKAYMAKYGFTSERALALFYDICVQLGSIGAGARWRYWRATAGKKLPEVYRLEAMARAIAPQGGKWSRDVLARKLTIARGRGIVHGRSFQLEHDFGVTLGPVVR